MAHRRALLLSALLLIAATPYEPPKSADRIVYRHGSVIDGTGAGSEPTWR